MIISFIKDNTQKILDLITALLIIFFIYTIIKEYYYTKKYENSAVTKYTDLEEKEIDAKYKDTKLYKIYHELTDTDKEYLCHILNAYRMKYKEDKPNYYKLIKTLKIQILYNAIITLFIKRNLTNAFDTLRHSTLLTVPALLR